ncbi:MAG TPA: response regulator, partial [Trebonia sp.]
MTPLRVLICEDSGTYATALRRMLEHDGDIIVVAICSTAEEAISVLPRTAPDLVTMDVALPG